MSTRDDDSSALNQEECPEKVEEEKDFGKVLALSLPPMPEQDLSMICMDLKKLGVFSEETKTELETRKCTIAAAPSSDDTPLMAAIRSKLEDHLQHFKEKDLTTRVLIQRLPEPEGAIAVHTYVEKLDVANFQTGAFSVAWNIFPDKETEVQISGSATLHSHYYEDTNNVQLRGRREYEKGTAGTAEEQVNAIVAKMEARTMSYEDKVAKSVAKYISSRETELYNDLKAMGEQLDEKLKKIRRILPITKTRFKWDASCQKQVRLLNERKTV